MSCNVFEISCNKRNHWNNALVANAGRNWHGMTNGRYQNYYMLIIGTSLINGVPARCQDSVRGGVSLRISSKIYPRCLFSLTPNVIGRYRISIARWSLFAHAEHDCLAGIFQLLDGVSFSSRQPLFTNKTRLMKPAMRRARRSEDLPLTLL
ncbi:hypothetical protein T02_7688 [Trichinella nativa]|uniref:Uncharacterized protein n=1 Tax=Trichinella nativa TaxID=6335 RepID=A0A0V1KZ60_9BILA|nr:hypothetical protein T02_7688 [Trichinella nativa]